MNSNYPEDRQAPTQSPSMLGPNPAPELDPEMLNQLLSLGGIQPGPPSAARTGEVNRYGPGVGRAMQGVGNVLSDPYYQRMVLGTLGRIQGPFLAIDQLVKAKAQEKVVSELVKQRTAKILQQYQKSTSQPEQPTPGQPPVPMQGRGQSEPMQWQTQQSPQPSQLLAPIQKQQQPDGQGFLGTPRGIRLRAAAGLPPGGFLELQEMAQKNVLGPVQAQREAELHGWETEKARSLVESRDEGTRASRQPAAPKAPGEDRYDRVGPDDKMHTYSRRYDFAQRKFVDQDLGLAKAPTFNEETITMRPKGEAILNKEYSPSQLEPDPDGSTYGYAINPQTGGYVYRGPRVLKSTRPEFTPQHIRTTFDSLWRQSKDIAVMQGYGDVLLMPDPLTGEMRPGYKWKNPKEAIPFVFDMYRRGVGGAMTSGILPKDIQPWVPEEYTAMEEQGLGTPKPPVADKPGFLQGLFKRQEEPQSKLDEFWVKDLGSKGWRFIQREGDYEVWEQPDGAQVQVMLTKE